MTSKLFSRLTTKNSALLICDLQEKFRNNIQYFPEIVTVTKRLITGAKIFDVKVLATEQYPKGLGHSVEELELKKFDINVVEKQKFSMCVSELMKHIPNDNKSIILCGIEAHVCVLQTTLDFLEQGKDVHIVVDGVSSRTMFDRKYAFERLKAAGAKLRTSESVLFELMKGSDHPKFREVQKLVLSPAPDSGLLNL
ncbi:Isochorismatase-like domain-containing protein [Strongyloides ratti]|uniref:Isochorismatase domain-containing protein 1 n=1 Tax=Strongyloides ratti TaxID=34506 RepID=A0A090L9W3_STRRB|nr:Isochorismatase-like domain-containing protein [Strongyloides ratti]CEF66537.1 Isochorismatase-like domain-containing protein [Strongyloides ratti]